MTRGFFITGTDTGVGKTVIAGALILFIKSLGLTVCGMKPIETGCMKSENREQRAESEVKDTLLIAADGIFLQGISDVDEPINSVVPICLKNPLAPFPAAEIEGIPVDIEKIKKAYTKLSEKYDAVVVEGIGGLLVPIKQDYFVLDLARDLGLPMIVVSRPSLGTINHTLLTINYAIKEGLNVAGIIINYSQPPEKTLAEKTNPEVIRQISPVPILGVFPYLEDTESNEIKQATTKCLNLEIIRNYLQTQAG